MQDFVHFCVNERQKALPASSGVRIVGQMLAIRPTMPPSRASCDGPEEAWTAMCP